jgi:hypothetical protein
LSFPLTFAWLLSNCDYDKEQAECEQAQLSQAPHGVAFAGSVHDVHFSCSPYLEGKSSLQ